ncbi:MAG: Na(+)/H(+) antiporter subunit D [Methanomicrobia archaeon]|nr:Na(+)/H(+) antiporter subunit D [Methanomicrobia archaeon]
MPATWIHPGFIYIFGALLIPLLKGKARQAYIILLPILALTDILLMALGVFGELPLETWEIPFLKYTLMLGHVDNLSVFFAFLFIIVSLAMFVYAVHVQEEWQHVAAFLYIGSTLGVVFAGDLFTLLFFWEVMAWASLFLIWYRKTEASRGAGFRYIMVHSFGGICLFAGVVLQLQATGGNIAWGFSSLVNPVTGGLDLAGTMILIAFMINGAVPPLHAWLSDAYPEATVTGTVFLNAFTTKSAIYVLLRAFTGYEALMWLGAIMAVYGIIYALIVNDIRRVLAYHIISQGGYMVAGIGIGTGLAVGGAIAHALCYTMCKTLLFMAAGAVLAATGTAKMSDLGGLYKYMPKTFWMWMIGAASISGFPLFAVFVSKPLVIESAVFAGQPWPWLLLEIASAGTFLCLAVKIPYLTWHEREKPANIVAHDPPLNMMIGMGILAVLCIGVAVYPYAMYNMITPAVEELASEVGSFEHYIAHPYAPKIVVELTMFFLFAFPAFWWVLKKPFTHREPKIALDLDWLYRISGKWFIWFCEKPLMAFATFIDRNVLKLAAFFVWISKNPAEALRIKGEETRLRMQRLMSTSERTKGYESGLEGARTRFPGELPKFGLGTSLLLILLFLVVYLLLYVTGM